MKNLVYLLFSFVFLLSCKVSDKEIIDKTISKLNSIETVEYEYVSHYLQKAQGMDRTDTAFSIFDFRSNDSLLGVKYQFKSKFGEYVFDGEKIFELIYKDEKILYTDNPEKRSVVSSMFLMNSIYELRKLLPIFITDTTIHITRAKDTLIEDVENYKFNILVKDRYILFGELAESKGYTSRYELYISKRDFLPTQFNNVYANNKGYLKAFFTNYKLNIDINNSIWSYDKFDKKYLRMTYYDYYKSEQIKREGLIGQKAPDWTLPQVLNDSIQLSSLKGNLVLLEFWFSGCRGCVKAIPELNRIQKQYFKNGLKVYGIEFTKSNNKGIEEYIQKEEIEYPTLYKGKEIAIEYGVNAAPTIFLIDRKGIIKYSSVGLDKEKLIKSIEDNI